VVAHEPVEVHVLPPLFIGGPTTLAGRRSAGSEALGRADDHDVLGVHEKVRQIHFRRRVIKIGKQTSSHGRFSSFLL